MGQTFRVRILVETRFSLLHKVQTGTQAYPTSYPMGTGSSFPGVKEHGREAGHSIASSNEVKNDRAITSHPYLSSVQSA
jgi:hypothetical protein